MILQASRLSPVPTLILATWVFLELFIYLVYFWALSLLLLHVGFSLLGQAGATLHCGTGFSLPCLLL